MNKNAFIEHLEGKGRTNNTITAYAFAVDQYHSKYKRINEINLQRYKKYLEEHFNAKTVNLRIHGINAYLAFLDKKDLSLKPVKVQQKPFLENIITQREYEKFCTYLSTLDDKRWYFAVRIMTTTGARVSELLRIEVSDIEKGYKDIISKGNKVRRIYIPKRTRLECLEWLNKIKPESELVIFENEGEHITTRSLSSRLKRFAIQCNIDPAVVYPHSFRHRFAKNFIKKCPDIAFLADLMGHENLETTRIYLRKTSQEQRRAVDRIVTW